MKQNRQENRGPFQDGKRNRAELMNDIYPHLKSFRAVEDAGIGSQVEAEKSAHGNQAQQRMQTPDDEFMPAEDRC